jgi:glycosyltransferase involved in cell wall biosynthesis
MRIGILTSHPIQYQAPWFRELTKLATLEVFFAFQPSAEEQAAGFGGAFTWDVDLLSGYRHRFLVNHAPRASANHFSGCNTPEISGIIRDEHFDAFIVCGWNLKSFWQAIRACRRQGVPVLVRGDSQLGMQRSRAIRAVKALVYPALRGQFDGFLSVGTRNREYLRHYGAPADRIFFAPHFVDNEWFREKAQQARPERNSLRNRWTADPETTVALFVGKFIPKKRPLDFLNGVRHARQKGGKVVPVLVGSGEMEPALRQYAEAEEIPAIFEGFRNQSELPACYVAADVLVLPSDFGETWGLVVNEAMGCGLPAVVSDAVGCAPDLIEEGVTGFTFPLGESEALGECLLKISSLAPSKLQDALSAKLEVYSAQTCARNTVAAVSEIIGSTPRDRPNGNPVR